MVNAQERRQGHHNDPPVRAQHGKWQARAIKLSVNATLCTSMRRALE